MKGLFPKWGKIRIGAILPFSGEAARYGQWIQEGLELGKEEINSKGGINNKRLQIVYQDDAAEPEKAARAMKKLAEDFKVPIVFGSWASSCVLAQVPIAEKTKTIVLAEALSPKILKVGEYIFSIQPDARYYLERLVPFALFDLDLKKISILYVNNDFGKDQADYFKKLFEKYGGKILSTQEFTQGQNDFKKELTKIQKEKPDALFIPAYTEIIPLLKQTKKLGLKIQILASPPFENPDILKQAAEAAEGVIYPYHYSPNPANELDVEFRKKYQKKYGREPEGFTALAYDGIQIIAKALKKCSQDRKCLKDEFHNIYYFGITGEVVFDKTGYPIKKIIIKMVKNGKFLEYNPKAVIGEKFQLPPITINY
jgi:branched-chain amino acid transport system substrate-binding protein